MQLEDGKGNGFKAAVDSSKRLSTFAVVESEFLNVNAADELAYVWNFPAYNYAAGDTVMWLRNDSNLDLHIHHIVIYSDTATTLQIHAPLNVTPAGTAVTGMNINLTSANEAEATSYQDETVGVLGPIIQTEYLPANQMVTMFKEDGYQLILGKNDIVAIDLTTVGTSTFGHIVGFYK